jgi:hypothetical protein
VAVPPLLEILRSNRRRLRAARRTLPHLADEESRRLLLQHVRRNLSPWHLEMPVGAAPLVPLRVSELGGTTVWCCSRLADFGLLHDAFESQHHLPPEDLTPVRTVVVLGAKIGLTLAHLAVRYSDAQLLGLEPDAAAGELCRKNIASLDGRCEVRCVPVSEAGGAIDAFGAAGIDYVWVDLDGAEKDVLAGAWLDRVRAIKVKVYPEKAPVFYTVGACTGDLEKHGFHPELDPRNPACIIGRRQ